MKYEIKFLPIAEVEKKFSDAEQMITALRDSALISFGDFCINPLQETAGSRVSIPAEAWRDYKYNGGTLLGGVDEYGSDDPVEYRNIVIEKASLDRLEDKKRQGRSVQYNWDAFWRDVAFEMFMSKGNIENLPSVSVRDWARNNANDCNYIWGDSPPSVSSIREKMNPLFKAIKSGEKDDLEG